MKNTDGNLLREHLFTWNAVDMQSTLLEENIRTLFDATVPIRFERISNRQKPLITNSIKRAIDLSDLAYSRWKRLRTAEMKFQYSATRANVNKCIRCVKMEYYFRQFASAIETRQTCGTISVAFIVIMLILILVLALI